MDVFRKLFGAASSNAAVLSLSNSSTQARAHPANLINLDILTAARTIFAAYPPH